MARSAVTRGFPEATWRLQRLLPKPRSQICYHSISVAFVALGQSDVRAAVARLRLPLQRKHQPSNSFQFFTAAPANHSGALRTVKLMPRTQAQPASAYMPDGL